jgi:hypothetical protein
VHAPMSMARSAAASRRSAPNERANRTTPRQARKPCSGCGRDSSINSHSDAVAGPINRASARMRSIVQPRIANGWRACARWRSCACDCRPRACARRSVLLEEDLARPRHLPDAGEKSVTMHVVRHSAAMRLLHAGHENIATTQIDLHANLAIKERALARTTPLRPGLADFAPPTNFWPSWRRSDYAGPITAIAAFQANLASMVGILRVLRAALQATQPSGRGQRA